MKAPNLFIKIVEMIKAQINPETAGGQSVDVDTILTDAAEPYDSLLYFLWACNKFPTEVASPPIQPIEDKYTLA